MASRHKAYLKNFNVKEHPIMFGGIGILIAVLIISGIISLISNSSHKKAENMYQSVANQVDYQQTSQRQTEVRKIAVHNSGAIDYTIGVSVNSSDESLSADSEFKLDTSNVNCRPGDAITSPEYHARRIASDKAFITNWILPVFTYSNLDDYYANCNTMRERFAEATNLSSDMYDCSVQFFAYIMPPADDLIIGMSDDEKAKYNGTCNVGTPYLLDADVTTAPYDYQYLIPVSFTSVNKATGSIGNSNGSATPDVANVVIVCMVARTDDGIPYLKTIRFSSLKGYTIGEE